MDPRLVFLEVVERGSFTAAADHLGISLSYASRRVRALEAELGVPLLARTTRRVQPTPEGLRYAERLAPLLRGLIELERETSDQPVEPSGTLRLALPLSFGLTAIQPLIVAFQQRWPGVVVDASFSDRTTDPLDYDVTIRGGMLDDSSLVARRLVGFRGVLAASPAYLAARGTPVRPEDIDGHDAVVYSGFRDRRGWTIGGIDVSPRVRLRSDNGDALVTAAAGGIGLVYQPDFILGPALRDGRLVPLLAGLETFTGAFWAIRRARTRTRTVTAFIDHLADTLTEEVTVSD
ncbi:MAG: LysR family transcriptional regulator [Alphaproteobacteria bacterium]|nr:LysR family transcriptional regulator [Alphaproteobacteria bacterium]